MVYQIVKTVSTPLSDKEFIEATKKFRTRRGLLACIPPISCAVCVRVLILCQDFESLIATLLLLPVILTLLAAGFVTRYWSAPCIGMMISDYKSDSDLRNIYTWLSLAEYVVPDGMFLAKYFEVYSLAPLEATSRSKELKCRDTSTGSIVTMSLEMVLEKRFQIMEDHRLGSGQMILDLCQKKPVAYIGTGGYGM